jgi:hypothetical protein
MELSSPEAIRALQAAFEDPEEVQHSRGAQHAVRPARQNRRVRCVCGHCRQCQDDARWNRIFAEKFADPTYYTGPVIHSASPLTSI